MKITTAQLKRLQTVYSQMCAHTLGYANTRESRLAWAKLVLGREVASFGELTLDQGRVLIDAAQGELGHRAPLKATARRGPRPSASPEAARRAGLDGRRDGEEFERTPELVSADLLEEISSRYQRLGWGAPQFESWLTSRSSPLRGRKQIRTTADANRVLWALKGMLQAAKLWVEFAA